MKTNPINNVCESTKPKKAEAKATKCLAVLLDGGVINRKTLGELGIAAYNDSAHSLISILRNERLIPIESFRQEDGTSDYFMLQDEIERYKDPDFRQQQKEEMRKLIETKRQAKINALLAKQKGDFKGI
jgi:hypothetical protein